MKLLGSTLALSLASLALVGVGCTGSIGGNGSKPGNSNPGGNPGPNNMTPPGNGNGPGDPGDPNNGKPPVVPPDVMRGQCNADTLAKPRAWRLTHEQVRNTLRDALGFSPPAIEAFPIEARIDQNNSRNGFANRADQMKISPLLADAYFKASEELAAEVAGKAATYGITCAVASLGQGTCLKTFLQNFGLKLWRRPLSEAEITSLTTFFNASSGYDGGAEGGLKNVVQAMFLSPRFLYRSEVGHTQAAGEVTVLTDYELASALSYSLWNTGPDATLLDLAGKGQLRTKDALVTQAKRMLATAQKTGPAMHSFVEQWLRIEGVDTAEKDTTIYSLGTMQVAQDLVAENHRFIDSVLFEGDKSFKTLFTASYGFVNARTAPIYGLTGVTGNDLVKRDLDKTQRRGLLTTAAFLWGHANPDGTHPVERGRYFREEILCEGVPDPPPTVLIDPQFGNATLTKREQLAIHEKEPACAACHVLIDGIGLSMENYDGIGKWRKDEVVQGGAVKPIDSTGKLPLPSGSELSFNNFIELIDQLANKKDIYSCFASQYLDYTTGHRPDEINNCEKTLVTDEFVNSGYNVESLVLAVVGSPSFMSRKN
jgi:hypothetical protein